MTMMRPPLPLALLLLLASCVSTTTHAEPDADIERAPEPALAPEGIEAPLAERDVEAAPAPQEPAAAPAPARDSRALDALVSAAWPDLVRIEEFARGGRRARARTELRSWLETGLNERGAAAEAGVDEQLALRVEALALALASSDALLAAREYLHELYAKRRHADDADLLAVTQNLAAAYYDVGDLAKCLELERAVLAAQERLHAPDHPAVLLARENLAVTISDLGEIDEALAMQQSVLAARRVALSAEHPDLLRAYQNVAALQFELGDLASATATFEELHRIHAAVRAPEDPVLLAAKGNLAAMKKVLGDLRAARELELDVVRARELTLPDDHHELALARMNLAATVHAFGDVRGADELLVRVHDTYVRTRPPEHPHLLAAKGNLALTRSSLGDIAGALDLAEYVCEVRSRTLPADHPDLLLSLGNLAALRREAGDVRGAFEIEERVLVERERALDAEHPDLLVARTNLAITARALGDSARGRELLELVHEVRTRALAPDHPDLLVTKLNLATVWSEDGDAAGAIELLAHVAESRARVLGPEHHDTLVAQNNLADECFRTGDLTRARELLERIHAVWSRNLPVGHPDRLTATDRLADVQLACVDHEAALRTSAEVVAGTRAAAQRLVLEAPRRARAGVAVELTRLAGSSRRCQRLRFHGLDGLEAEHLLALEDLRTVAADAAVLERLAASDAQVRQLLAERTRVGTELSEATQAPPVDANEVDAWRARLYELGERRDGIARNLRALLAANGAQLEERTIDDIASELPEGAALVSFWRRPFRSIGSQQEETSRADRLLAFVVDRDARVEQLDLGAVGEVEVAIDAWQASIGSPTLARGLGIEAESDARAASEEAGRRLVEAVLSPVLAAAPNATELRLVLDDVLYLVPLDALPHGGASIGDHVTVRVGNTARAFRHEERAAPANGGLLLVGGVDFGARAAQPGGAFEFTAMAPVARVERGSTFTQLVGAAEEVSAIARLYESAAGEAPTSLTGSAATKAAVVEALSNTRHLHVATHGWFADESSATSLLDDTSEPVAAAARAKDMIVGFMPETLCGLALAGANYGPEGILTAEELATLDLTNCELAVLSACETNVGIRRAGQGIQSLQTALHAAGARTAITSLWKVDDAATRKLFELFYTKLWSEKLGPADALWQAKLALRNDGHPTRDWAGWVLTGDPD